MQWFTNSIRNSLYAMLGHAEPTESRLEEGVEGIRERMLELLDASGESDDAQLARRVRFASDIHALWYLRGDLMAALACEQGEVAAREQVRQLTRMFRGLLPPQLVRSFAS